MSGIPTCFRTTDRADLEFFAAQYSKVSGHSTTLADLQRPGQAVRVLELQGQIIGGFVSRWEPPFRYLAILPEGAELLAPVDPDQTVESTHNWLKRGVPKHARALYYLTMGWEGLRSGKRDALGGTSEARIRDLHMRYYTELLYEGPGLDTDGTVHPQAWLYRGRIATMFLGLPHMMLRSSSRVR